MIVIVTGQRFVEKLYFENQVNNATIYAYCYQKYGFNKKGKPIMIKIEIEKKGEKNE